MGVVYQSSIGAFWASTWLESARIRVERVVRRAREEVEMKRDMAGIGLRVGC